jgi:AraC family transcriptional regulator
MMSRLGEHISLQEVAASVQLSTGHFATAFKQSLGVAPHAWLRRQRIEQASRLFRDPNLDLTQIAIVVGYANQSSFGVGFRERPASHQCNGECAKWYETTCAAA